MSIFNSIQIPKVPRSRFNMSHYNNMSADYGRLYPFLFIDCVPNDTFKLGADVLINTAPMITAPYTQNDVRLDYFFVPYRLLWNNWKDFITGGEDGTAEPVMPFITTNQWSHDFSDYSPKCLLSYFGVKGFVHPGAQRMPVSEEPINSLPLRAYALIWNEWYRDQNLQDEIMICQDDDGQESDFVGSFRYFCDSYGFLHRGWRKDYFTSALPSPQRGVEVPINFGSNFEVPIQFKANLANTFTKLTGTVRAKLGDDLIAPDEWSTPNNGAIVVNNGSGVYLRVAADGTLKQVSEQEVSGGGLHVYSADEIEDVYAPLGQWFKNLLNDNPGAAYINTQDLPAITINDLRRANAIQVWLERNMRAGARYVEQILSHFGVRVPDYRLDRPEYIGGEQFPVQISQIFQNSESTQDSAIGSYGGKGKASVSARVRKYRVEEHGCIIGLMSILPKAVYANGINHFFLQHDKFSFYFPEFANLGEQQIKTKEVAVTEDMVDSQGVIRDDDFGYTPRYAHMKFIPNQVNGDFLMSGMRHFTQFREFATEPTLSPNFIEVSPISDGINRIWAVEDDSFADHFWCTIFNQVHAKRPMPKYGTPKLIG